MIVVVLLNKPSNSSCTLFFCSKFVRGSETKVVWVHLAFNFFSVERLGARDGPVIVDLVLSFAGNFVTLAEGARYVDGGLAGEFVLDSTTDGDWLALDALEVFTVAVDGFERVVNALLELLVATGHDEGSSDVSAHPVERLGAGLRLVDKLGEDFRESLSVSLTGNTDVVLSVELNVNLRLDSHGLLVVEFNINVDSGLGTSKIVSLSGKLTSEFPFTLLLLHLGSSGNINGVLLLLENIGIGLKGHLVVGKGVGSGAVAVVDLELSDGLVSELGDDGGVGGGLFLLALAGQG